MFTPPKADHYNNITSEKLTCTVGLIQDEQNAILKAFDYGIEALREEEKQKIDSVLSKLKDQIHP